VDFFNRWATREKTEWGVRIGLSGYKIEKSKLTSIKANCGLHPLIHTSATSESSTKCGSSVSGGEVWIQVWYLNSQQVLMDFMFDALFYLSTASIFTLTKLTIGKKIFLMPLG